MPIGVVYTQNRLTKMIERKFLLENVGYGKFIKRQEITEKTFSKTINEIISQKILKFAYELVNFYV